MVKIFYDENNKEHIQLLTDYDDFKYYLKVFFYDTKDICYKDSHIIKKIIPKHQMKYLLIECTKLINHYYGVDYFTFEEDLLIQDLKGRGYKNYVKIYKDYLICKLNEN
jgi:hypothetical protein